MCFAWSYSIEPTINNLRLSISQKVIQEYLENLPRLPYFPARIISSDRYLPCRLSELANQKRKNTNLGHIERIAEALNINNIRAIIELVDIDD